MDLSTTFCGIQLQHPVMPAAGPPVRDGERGRMALEGGASCIVTKTISRSRAQIPRPYLTQQGDGMLNAESWSERSPWDWLAEDIPLLKVGGAPLIISLGYTAADMEYLVPRFSPHASALELSTHYLGNDSTPMVQAVEKARELTDLPLLVKVSPGGDIAQIVKAAEEAGADGLVLINSLGPCLDFQLFPWRLLLGSKDGCGYLSGPPIFPLALGAVLQAAQISSLPIIGVGGIRQGEDVVKMVMTGASAVQVCTQALLEGPSIYRRLKEETGAVLERLHLSSLQEAKGRLLKEIPPLHHPQLLPRVNAGDCSGCGRCLLSCSFGALIMEEKKAFIREERCQRCGLCSSRCLQGAITWEGMA